MSGDPTVSTGEIARLGGVGRAAVSNWRRRHADFPSPVAGSTASPRFALADVEAWLRRNGRAYRLSTADLAWQRLRPDELLLTSRLAAAGAYLVERAEPGLAGRLPEPAAEVDIDHRSLDELASAVGPAAAFEELCSRHRGRPDVADDLAAAMVHIALPRSGTVLDPACGTGGLLLAAAPRRVRGQCAEPDQARVAAARLLLAGIDAHVHVADALHAEPAATLVADAVVCAPPSDRARGHGELAGDPRFAYGLPPRTEPELAWLQHSLARVRPGGTVVLLLPPAVAGRRAGRRIRANLLRAGALRAVIGVPDGDLWVLRRPRPGDPLPPTVAFGRTGPDGAAALWEAFRTGEPLPDGVAVPLAPLLDDDVDLGPDQHLPRGHGPDPAAAYRALLPVAADVPALTASAQRRDLPTTTIADLARAGALRVRVATSGLVLGHGDTPVLTVADLATGTRPTGRTAASRALTRVRAGDVVASAMGRVRVATTRAVLGPGLVAYRVDPDRLDPEFLAGVLRAAPVPTGSSSTRHGQRARVPLLEPAEQRAYGEAFRRLLAAADTARATAERTEALLRIGGDGLVEGWLLPEQQ